MISRKFLKLYQDSASFPSNRAEPVGEELEESFIDKILKHKLQRGRKFFLVRWMHFDKSADPWEPIESFFG